MSVKSSLKDEVVLESESKQKVIDYAKEKGWFHWHIMFVNRCGCPDSLFIRKGEVVFVEFKRPVGGKVSPLQKKVIARMKRAGANVYIIKGLTSHVREIFD